MACFPLCAACDGEYTDPTDRRFHAEPVCCPACGPILWIQDADGGNRAEGHAAIAAAQADLLAGRILAIKGLGGFQLACRADDDAAVRLLRQRKRRSGKPFAVMVRNLGTARGIVDLAPDDEVLLRSSRAPVILAPRLRCDLACDEIAPGLDDVGVMLPTTPLHVELFRDERVPALVMTSANLSEEPICRGNREAIDRLADLADRFLLHDRDIIRRVDDSVVRSTATGPILVRRARGWVPDPIALPVEAPEPLLAVGGHLVVTSCIAVGGQAFMTQHVGDLDSVPARTFHREVIDGLEDFLEVRPKALVADAHPDYPSAWLAAELAKKRNGSVLEVQHHLAHGAAVLGEHGRFPESDATAYAITLDGTGWGPDGTAWGGEWLSLTGGLEWRRLAQLEALALIGGERAVREPWRVAVAALAAAGAVELIPELPFAVMVDSDHLDQVARLATSPHWPRASGAGRLFEAAGAVFGLVIRNDWEGEAAARLEALAASAGETVASWNEVGIRFDSGFPMLPSSALLRAAAARLIDGEAPAKVAAGFHSTFNHLVVEITRQVVQVKGGEVALGGGCMVNRLLLTGLDRGLAAHGFGVLIPRNLPPGDGGLAYGQAVLGAVALARNVKPKMLI
jgi:hydrogenase maturation protein HypF